jgi:hypothetical protein
MKRFYALCVLALFPIACGHADAAASTTIVGSWKSAAPPHRVTLADSVPQITSIIFGTNGKATMHYVPAFPTMGGMLPGAEIVSMTKPKTDVLPYDDLGGGKLRFTVGAQAVTYTYDIKDGKLYLSPPGTTGSYVFNRS